jgi:tetratricopeptide (TPR) repeat protein
MERFFLRGFVYLRPKFFCILIVLSLALPVFGSEWYQDYEKGQKAIDKGKCDEGVPLMLEALKKNPKSDLKARPYGMQLWEYIPHFYLTKCAVARGDFAAASAYMKAAEDGNISSSSKASQFRQLKQTIQQNTQKTPVVITQPKQQTEPPAENPVEKKPVVKPVPVQPIPTAPAPDPEEVKRSMVARILREAKDAFNAGNFDEARNAANRVLGMDPDNSEAKRLLTQIAQRIDVDESSQRKAVKIAEIRRTYKNGDLTGAENLILQFQKEFPTDPAVASVLEEIRKRKETELKTLSLEEAKKFQEKQVLLAYFTGNYEAVLQLAEQGLTNHPQSWRLYFYQGCAEAALGLLEGPRSDERITRAKQSFRRAKALAGNISVPPQISPKIIEIYRSS